MVDALIHVVGAPGSGKDTALRYLRGAPRLNFFSMSAELERAVANGHPRSEEISDCMQKSTLVPDDIVSDLVIQAVDNQHGVLVINGFPRTRLQGLQIYNAVPGMGTQKPIFAVLFETRPDICINRMVGRGRADSANFESAKVRFNQHTLHWARVSAYLQAYSQASVIIVEHNERTIESKVEELCAAFEFFGVRLSDWPAIVV